MNNKLTELVMIIDRSGSMSGLIDDAIGGYNSFIEKQKEEDGEVVLTTILFDDKYEILHDRVNLENIQPLTRKEYFARGMTALLDAIGKTINNIGENLNNTPEEERPSKIIFVITTDGFENASREFSYSKIKEMIEHQQEKYNWQFLFLGANIDAIGTANSLGISSKYASNYTASKAGTDSLYTSLCRTVSNYRDKGTIEDNWQENIE